MRKPIDPGEKMVKDIKRAEFNQDSAEETIQTVLSGYAAVASIGHCVPMCQTGCYASQGQCVVQYL